MAWRRHDANTPAEPLTSTPATPEAPQHEYAQASRGWTTGCPHAGLGPMGSGWLEGRCMQSLLRCAVCWRSVGTVNTVTLERPRCGCMIGGRVLRPRLQRGDTAHTPIAAPQPPPSPCNTSPVRQPPGCIALPSRRFAAGCPGCQWLRWCRGALRPITGAKKIMCKRSAHACVDHSPPAGDICMCCYAALQMC